MYSDNSTVGTVRCPSSTEEQQEEEEEGQHGLHLGNEQISAKHMGKGCEMEEVQAACLSHTERTVLGDCLRRRSVDRDRPRS